MNWKNFLSIGNSTMNSHKVTDNFSLMSHNNTKWIDVFALMAHFHKEIMYDILFDSPFGNLKFYLVSPFGIQTYAKFQVFLTLSVFQETVILRNQGRWAVWKLKIGQYCYIMIRIKCAKFQVFSKLSAWVS